MLTFYFHFFPDRKKIIEHDNKSNLDQLRSHLLNKIQILENQAEKSSSDQTAFMEDMEHSISQFVQYKDKVLPFGRLWRIIYSTTRKFNISMLRPVY